MQGQLMNQEKSARKNEEYKLKSDEKVKDNYKLIGVIAILLAIAYFKGTGVLNPEEFNFGAWAVMPAVAAVILAFITRDALFSLLVASISGLFIQGKGLWGLPGLFMKALGNADFIWVVMIEILIGILVAFFFKTGTTEEFAKVVGTKVKSRRGVQLMGWFLGMFIFFSDYFSPLFVISTNVGFGTIHSVGGIPFRFADWSWSDCRSSDSDSSIY